jgi:hypothetical protein
LWGSRAMGWSKQQAEPHAPHTCLATTRDIQGASLKGSEPRGGRTLEISTNEMYRTP